jgi:hypothetical protein
MKVRLFPVIVILALTIISFTVIHHLLAKYNESQNPPKPIYCENTEVNPNQLNIVLFDNSEAHDEVVLAFANVFASIENSKLFLFKDKYNYLMEDILFSFESTHTLRKPNNITCFRRWIENQTLPRAAPDIVLSDTCEWNFAWHREEFRYLLNNTSAFVFCVVHQGLEFLNIDKEVRDLYNDWVKANRIMFITLSPHVTKWIKDYVKWLRHPIVNTVIPVFPVKTLDKNVDYTTRRPNAPLEVHLAVQGYYQAHRRDYSDLITQLQEVSLSETLSKKYNFTLHLLGNGDHPEVPEKLKNRIVFHDFLTYEQFYELLSKMFVLLPALNLPDYTWNKISSTIPASLISQVPMIASPIMLEAYTFLNDTLVWRANNQTDLEAILDILENKPKSIAVIRDNVKRYSEQIVEDNKKLFHEWFQTYVPKYRQVMSK